MKLQVSFDITNLEKALEIAKKIVPFIDIFEIGSILIHKHGIEAITKFKKEFPKITLLADIKIVDRAKQEVALFSNAGVNWITVMAGSGSSVIHSACIEAKKQGLKVMLDLLDAESLGQSAMEAKNLGVDALLFHQPFDQEGQQVLLDKWDMVKGNTTLPIFVSAKINRNNISQILELYPDGIIIGKSIVDADDPAKEAEFFAQLIRKKS